MPEQKIHLVNKIKQNIPHIVLDTGYKWNKQIFSNKKKPLGCIKTIKDESCELLYLGARDIRWLKKVVERLLNILEERYPVEGDIRALERQKLKAVAALLHTKVK